MLGMKIIILNIGNIQGNFFIWTCLTNIFIPGQRKVLTFFTMRVRWLSDYSCFMFSQEGCHNHTRMWRRIQALHKMYWVHPYKILWSFAISLMPTRRFCTISLFFDVIVLTDVSSRIDIFKTLDRSIRLAVRVKFDQMVHTWNFS